MDDDSREPEGRRASAIGQYASTYGVRVGLGTRSLILIGHRRRHAGLSTSCGIRRFSRWEPRRDHPPAPAYAFNWYAIGVWSRLIATIAVMPNISELPRWRSC